MISFDNFISNGTLLGMHKKNLFFKYLFGIIRRKIFVINVSNFAFKIYFIILNETDATFKRNIYFFTA